MCFDKKRVVSESEKEHEKVLEYNATQGEQADFDCTECKNKGYVALLDDVTQQMLVQRCKCFLKRRTLRQIKATGVKDIKTFDSFKVTENWQENVLKMAKNFCLEDSGKWFYMGGQVGSGKTHLCTAILSYYLNKGLGCTYMAWKDKATALKACVNDGEEYLNLITPIKTARVLYIDDFLKTRPDELPTTGDLNLAFEIINYRYNNKDLITLISSERTLAEITKLDEAIGSRIFERSIGTCINIKKDSGKNYRMSL